MTAVIARPEDRAPERFAEPGRGDVSWVTLFSGDATPTAALSAGVMELVPGGRLEAHRHAQAEIYYVAAGEGVLSVDGVLSTISAGMAAFIPSDALHAVRNESPAMLRVFYVFPADRFSDVVYHFADGQ